MRAPVGLQSHLHALGIDLVDAFEQLDRPAALVAPDGVCLWQNGAAIAFAGDVQGRQFGAVAPDYVASARASFARKVLGADPVTHTGIVLIDANGERRHAEVTTFSLVRDGELTALLSIVQAVTAVEPEAATRTLSPREHQTLLMLSAGLTTAEIAERLGVARETARNHIRGVMRALGVHSRVAAVARARELGLI
jgi:DNA-binding CsgD family transcriptional regulator